MPDRKMTDRKAGSPDTLAGTLSGTLSENAPKENIVIVGNGMVGHYCAEQLAERGLCDQYDVHIFGAERHLAYDRVHLTEYMAKRDEEALRLADTGFHERHGITLHLGEEVTGLDRDAHKVETPKGALSYKYLVLALGSTPFVPSIPGNTGDAGLVYRTLDDLDAIRDAAKGAKHGAVIGGGLLGLEAARALALLGLETDIIEFGSHLMGAQLDAEGGKALRKRVEALGLRVHTSRATKEILPSRGDARYELVFAPRKEGECAPEPLKTDLVVFSAGIRPVDGLARSAGLEIGKRGGIVIDDRCRVKDAKTGEIDDAIFAVGECALWNGMIYGLVAPGYAMARTVAGVLDGDEKAAFRGADMSTKLKLQGVDVGSIGDAHGREPGATSYRFIGEADASYRRLVMSADGKRVTGAILVGDNSYYDTIAQYVQNALAPPEDPAQLILPAGENEGATLSADALPDTAVICSCLNVTKGDLVKAIDGGCHDMAALKAETKASTGCGGCAPMVKSLLDAELAARGMEVDNALCEHFAHTRQELYALTRVHDIRTFEELYRRFGRHEEAREDSHEESHENSGPEGGLGCDICKPTVVSIFASAWNVRVMEPDYAPLLETNETFLANMQKDGTYSVVPRIPAGEITPEKLIVIGEVGKKYNLYTKITGGQRIDLFGARLEQLPDIWGELIEAGFETGQAYGKSFRTAKACVGRTWCRYGVQDSTGKALELEDRYKGLRAPHKIKFGISGCTRECAEAQGKDVGIIATEKGWNLYVCGNGGMRPRHADLFATDLDEKTLIKYIDRFLMFYIRTADKLQRTSTWFENLEGGLDYLRSVVIEDSLGIGEELERQMQYVVDRYHDEWKDAISDRESLKRFRTFVNDKRPDPAIKFEQERGQIKPAPNPAESQGAPGPEAWTDLCGVEDLVANSGIVAWWGSWQVALYYLPAKKGLPEKGENFPARVFAVDNHDPFTNANVIGRGLMGNIGPQIVVSSPLHKERFDLETGICLENPQIRLHVWDARLTPEGRVEIKARPKNKGENEAENEAAPAQANTTQANTAQKAA